MFNRCSLSVSGQVTRDLFGKNERVPCFAWKKDHMIFPFPHTVRVDSRSTCLAGENLLLFLFTVSCKGISPVFAYLSLVTVAPSHFLPDMNDHFDLVFTCFSLVDPNYCNVEN